MPHVALPARFRSGLRRAAFVLLVVAVGVCVGLSLAQPFTAAAATNDTINFQARLEHNTGTAVGEGSYNVEFKIYDSQSGGQALWTESYLNIHDNGLRTKNGYLMARLGSIKAFPADMNWSQPLWLTMNIGGLEDAPAWDGEMNPRLRLTAVPYAFQARQLSTTTGSHTSTLGWLTQTAANNIYLPDRSGTLCISGDSEGCGFVSGSADSFIQNGTSPQSGASFNIGGSGTIGGNLILSGEGSSIVGAKGLSVTTSGGDLVISTVGSGDIALNSAGSVSVAPSATGNLVLGNAAGTGKITVGHSNQSQTVEIGSGTGATTVNIANNDTAGNTVNIATGSGSHKITLGNTVPTTVTTIRGGTLDLQTSSYTAKLGAKGLGLGGVSVDATADLTFGNGMDRTINAQQSATGKGSNLTIVAGQGAGFGDSGGDLVLQAGAAGGAGGTAGTVVARANGSDSAATPTFAVQSANATDLLAAYTGTGLVKIGIGTPTLAATGLGDLYVSGSGEFGLGLRVGNGLDGLNFRVGTAPSAANGFFLGNSRPVKTVSMVPQFNGMTTSRNSKGSLTTGFDNKSGAFRNYYNWTTADKDAQTETMYVQIAVPRDFSGFTSGDKLCYDVYTDDISDKTKIKTTFYDTENAAQPEFDATPEQKETWQKRCTDKIGGTITVNGSTYVTVQITLTVAQNKNVRLSNFTFDYLSAF